MSALASYRRSRIVQTLWKIRRDVKKCEQRADRCRRLLSSMTPAVESGIVDHVVSLVDEEKCKDINEVKETEVKNILEGAGVESKAAEAFWKALIADEVAIQNGFDYIFSLTTRVGTQIIVRGFRALLWYGTSVVQQAHMLHVRDIFESGWGDEKDS